MTEDPLNNVNFSWTIVKSTISERIINNSVTHTFHDNKLLKRTKFLNKELSKYSRFKSYAHYVKVKSAILKKLPIDKDSDSNLNSTKNNHNLPCNSHSDSSCSDDEEYNQSGNSITDRHSSITLKDVTKKNNSIDITRKKRLETSDSPSSSNVKDSFKLSRVSTRRKSATQSKLTSFLKKDESILHDKKSSLREKAIISNENETVTINSSRKSRKNSTQISPPTSNCKSRGEQNNHETKTLKTREDVKKNLSLIISNVDTKDVTEENNLNESHYDSELSLSNALAVAQSTQYPDDSSDESQSKDYYSQSKDSGVSNANSVCNGSSGDETFGEKITDPYSSENETLRYTDIEQNSNQRKKKSLKITDTQIFNNIVKIVDNKQISYNFHKKELKSTESDVSKENKIALEEFKSQSNNEKEKSIENKREIETKDDKEEMESKDDEALKNENDESQIKVIDDEKEKHFAAEEESESGEDIGKIKKFIIRKSVNAKNDIKKTPSKEKSDEFQGSAQKQNKDEDSGNNNRQITEIDTEDFSKSQCLVEQNDQEVQDESAEFFEPNSSEDEKETEHQEQELTQKYVKHSRTDEKRNSIEKRSEMSSSEKEENKTSDEDDMEDTELLEKTPANLSSQNSNLTDNSQFNDKNKTGRSSSDEENKEENNFLHNNQSQDMMIYQYTSDEDQGKILTQFRERTNSISDDEEMRLTLENEQNEDNFHNLDDNKITIEEHKIEIPEEHSEDTEMMSAQSLKCVNQRKRLNLITAIGTSSSDEEVSKKTIIKNKKHIIKLTSSDSDSEVDSKKIAHKKKKIKKIEKSLKKERSKSEDSVKSECDSHEDNKKSKKKKKKSRASADNEVIEEKYHKSDKTKKIFKEKFVQSSSDSEEEDNKKRKKINKEKNLRENTPKKNNSHLENSGKISEESQESSNLSQTNIKNMEKKNSSCEDDTDFQSYVKDGISYFKQKEETCKSKKQKKSKKEKNEMQQELKKVVNKKTLSTSQIIDETQSQNIVDPSQIISEPSIQISMIDNSTKSSKSKTDVEIGSLDSKVINELDDLIQKENLIECNLPSHFTVNDISENEEVWVFEIPKKEVSNDWIGKKFSFNGTELKIGNNNYQATSKKIKSMTCVLSSEKSKRPYKAVHFQPIYSIYVRSKNSVNNSIDEDNSTKVSSESRKDEEIIKKIKRKHSSKISSVETETPEIKKRRLSSFSSENDDNKNDSKINIKKKKLWSINDFLLDEKPPALPSKHLNIHSPKCNIISSDVEITDDEIKTKKEKLEIQRKSPLIITKKKTKISPKKVKDEKTFKSPMKREKSNISEGVKEKNKQVDIKIKKKNKEEDVQVKRKKSITWNVESMSDVKDEKNDVTEISKKFKKSKEVGKKIKNILREFQPNKKNEIVTTDTSDFEVKDVKKREKKLLKKKGRLSENLNDTESSTQEDIKPKEEKPKKRTTKLIDFDH